jgi:predicted glycoside hydrolase/deacetylase ChbG (UPF0249 family)
VEPNPILQQLGYDDYARVVIIHADDIGMCHATLPAYADLTTTGLVSSAAVMVPCAWFPSVAAYCREHPEADMGVHITLTCEWDACRWGPISTGDPAAGLMDDEGYFFRTSQDAQNHADSDAARTEINAQINRAVAAGILPTHIDTHMGSVLHPKLAGHYAEAAYTRRLIAFAPRAIEQAASLIPAGMPMVDHYAMMPLEGEKTLDTAKQMLSALPPGITHFIIHPACDTPELRALAADWRARVADYELFMSDDLRQFIADQQIHITGYRALQNLFKP